MIRRVPVRGHNRHRHLVLDMLMDIVATGHLIQCRIRIGHAAHHPIGSRWLIVVRVNHIDSTRDRERVIPPTIQGEYARKMRAQKPGSYHTRELLGIFECFAQKVEPSRLSVLQTLNVVKWWFKVDLLRKARTGHFITRTPSPLHRPLSCIRL